MIETNDILFTKFLVNKAIKRTLDEDMDYFNSQYTALSTGALSAANKKISKFIKFETATFSIWYANYYIKGGLKIVPEEILNAYGWLITDVKNCIIKHLLEELKKILCEQNKEE